MEGRVLCRCGFTAQAFGLLLREKVEEKEMGMFIGMSPPEKEGGDGEPR